MIDWPKVILNLRSKMSQADIARRLDVHPATISTLVNGVNLQPRLPLAIALLDLHYDLCHEMHDRRLFLYE